MVYLIFIHKNLNHVVKLASSVLYSKHRDHTMRIRTSNTLHIDVYDTGASASILLWGGEKRTFLEEGGSYTRV